MHFQKKANNTLRRKTELRLEATGQRSRLLLSSSYLLFRLIKRGGRGGKEKSSDASNKIEFQEPLAPPRFPIFTQKSIR